MTHNGEGPLCAAVISTGTEFFVGRRLRKGDDDGHLDLRDARQAPTDLNGRMIRWALATLGLDVVHQSIKPDLAHLLVHEIDHVLELGVDVVVISGGTGSTPDDKTNEVIGTVTGRPLELVARLWPLVLKRQRAQGVEDGDALTAAVTKQLSLPKGAAPFPPPGTAPPYYVIAHGVMYIILPGPPWECEAALRMVLQNRRVRNWLARGHALRTGEVSMFGGDETAVNAALADARRQGLTEGLPAEITCFEESGGKSSVRMRITRGQQGAWTALESFLEARFGQDLLPGGASLDELVAPLLAGRRVGIYGSGLAAAGLYLRLAPAASVRARLFGSAEEALRFASVDSSGESLARSIAAQGLAVDRVDWAVAIVGEAPAHVCIAGSFGAPVIRALVAPQDLTDDAAGEFQNARAEYLTFGMLRALYQAALSSPRLLGARFGRRQHQRSPLNGTAGQTVSPGHTTGTSS